MKQCLVRDRFLIIREKICKAGHTLEESAAALYGAVIPGSGTAVIAHEQHVDSEGIGAVLIDDIQRIDDVAS